MLVVEPLGSFTVNCMQVPAAEPVQLNASLTLDQLIVFPWKLIEPWHDDALLALQLLLANIAVATFWLICA